MEPSHFSVLHPGALFCGRYEVVRCIKAGAMGAVYEVLDTVTHSRRALKVMLPGIVDDPDLRVRFAQEAKITGGVESDHIVRVSDAGIDASSRMPFLVMDLLRGEELGSMLRRRGPLPPAEVVTYLFQVALALEKTHAAGIVHRDLKPENLFVTSRDDGTPCIKILDFGIAKVAAQSSQAKGTVPIGTPLYMSPEQIRGDGDIGPRADLYALGHIAHAVLSGEAYWTAEMKAAPSIFPVLSKILAGPLEPPSVRSAWRGVLLPPAFDAWFLRATALRPEHRFEGARAAVGALVEALGLSSPRASLPSHPRLLPETAIPIEGAGAQAVQAQDPVKSQGSGPQAPPGNATGAPTTHTTRVWRRRRRGLLPLAVAPLGLLLLGLLGFMLWRMTPAHDESRVVDASFHEADGASSAQAVAESASTSSPSAPPAPSSRVPEPLPIATAAAGPPPVPSNAAKPSAASAAAPSRTTSAPAAAQSNAPRPKPAPTPAPSATAVRKQRSIF
ncbi:serine/threonine-protein kinase [Sorangium atrum]|uniref:Protein kinase n=1 Tax=Sorangium atrum TaxID=2995308 RepID=A0ABT5C2Q2_9BACT|nr:serine/threonine-protein kinase [Sorangium aterium]MDC0680681.1 protein kinase [Sorangium aterium]